jgi:hypothetical protein
LTLYRKNVGVGASGVPHDPLPVLRARAILNSFHCVSRSLFLSLDTLISFSRLLNKPHWWLLVNSGPGIP